MGGAFYMEHRRGQAPKLAERALTQPHTFYKQEGGAGGVSGGTLTPAPCCDDSSNAVGGG
jgi:hypothetical protein